MRAIWKSTALITRPVNILGGNVAVAGIRHCVSLSGHYVRGGIGGEIDSHPIPSDENRSFVMEMALAPSADLGMRAKWKGPLWKEHMDIKTLRNAREVARQIGDSGTSISLNIGFAIECIEKKMDPSAGIEMAKVNLREAEEHLEAAKKALHSISSDSTDSSANAGGVTH